MNQRYPRESLVRIVEQAMVYQCACPAQVCKALFQIRDLHAYQVACASRNDTDRAVHERIAEACARNHAELEQCLEDVLRLEGWDPVTLTMPTTLDKLPRASDPAAGA